MLGWNDGTGKEIFSMQELIASFDMSRVHKGGAKFDFEKAKWFNHEWIKRLDVETFHERVKDRIPANDWPREKLLRMLALVKDRCTLLSDITAQSAFFFRSPEPPDTAALKPKWNEQKTEFFRQLLKNWEITADWSPEVLEANLQTTAIANQLKPGEVLLPLRIMLVGGKFGPGVFDIAALLGKEETLSRIQKLLDRLMTEL